MNNLKIRTKLLISFISIALLAGLIGYIGISNLNKIDNASTRLYSDVTKPLGTSVDIVSNYQRIRVNVREVVIAENREQVIGYLKRISDLSLKMDSAINVYQATTVDDTDKKNIAAVVAAKTAYLTILPELKILAENNKNKEAAAKIHGEWKHFNDDFQKAIDNLVSYAVSYGKTVADSNNVLAASSTNFLLIAIVIALLLAILLGFLISSNIQNIISSVIKQTKELVASAIGGNLATRARPDETNQEFREIVVGINKTLDAVIGPLNVAAEYVDCISKGQIPPKITDSYNGDFNEIKNNINSLIETLNAFAKAQDDIYKKHHLDGMIMEKIDTSKFSGFYSQIADSVNKLAEGHISVKMRVVDIVKKYAVGDFSEDMEKLPGQKKQVTDAIDQVKANLKAMNNEILLLVKAALDGKLSVRADESKFQHNFKDMVAGINQTLDAVINPLTVSAEYLAKIAIGDIPPAITEHYNGDFNSIKNNLNLLIASQNQIIERAKMVAKGDLTIELVKRSEKDELMQALMDMVKSIAMVLSEVKAAAELLAESSAEMSATTQQMSQGSSEQASSAEEVTSSMEEMVANIQQNTDNAQQTEKIALKAAKDIDEGSKAVNLTIESMLNIAEKIAVVSDIAEKIDILAINAAIEAARAGDHGKGFAVVASEVRKLAEHSQIAAKEINEVSSSSVKIAEKSGKLLVEIVPDIQKTSKLVQEISASSIEQNSGAGQINNAIQQLNQVTQENAASAEELSSSAEELSSQAEQLQEVIGFFTLKEEFTHKITKKMQNTNNAHSQTKKVSSPLIHKSQYTSKGLHLKMDSRDHLDNEFETM